MIKIYIGRIEYRISLLFPATLVVLLSIDNTGIPAWCIAASAMHEAGHFAAMYAFGYRPHLVSIGFFGISVHHREELSGIKAVFIALAGPAVNMISFAVLFSISGWTTPVLVHLVMAVFNLMPIEALDGGQALYFILAELKGAEKAEQISFIVSVLILMPLASIGFFLLLKNGYNFTLLGISVYLGLLLILKRRR